MTFKSNKQRKCVMAQLNTTKSEKLNDRMKVKNEKKLNALKKFNNITIIGKRWFEKTNGNTYHSTEVYVDGKMIGREDFAYGYDEGYVQTGYDILRKNGYYKTREDGGTYYDFSTDRRENHDKIITSVSDVSRKRDL